MIRYKRICILDTETTSVYWNSAAPVQLAALICDSHGNIIDKFNEKIKTTHTIDPGASEVHGIYAKDLVNCRSEREVLTDFCLWMQNLGADVVLTYNGEAFDRPMLNCRCKACGVNFNYFEKDNFPGLDGHSCVTKAKRMNYKQMKDKLGRKWRLSLVAETLGYSSEGAHDAFADVMMLKNIFFELDPVVNPENWQFDEEGHFDASGKSNGVDGIKDDKNKVNAKSVFDGLF